MKIRFYAGGLLLLAALGLTGCSTVEAPPQHVVLVNHSGQSLYLTGPKARKPESTNDFDQHLAAITKAIATDTNCIAPDGTRQILIFVHGGLNTYNQSLTRANEITPKISAAHYYPLFVNWDSGLKSSYLEHLFLVRQGEVEPVWGPVTFPLYFVADVGRAVNPGAGRLVLPDYQRPYDDGALRESDSFQPQQFQLAGAGLHRRPVRALSFDRERPAYVVEPMRLFLILCRHFSIQTGDGAGH